MGTQHEGRQRPALGIGLGQGGRVTMFLCLELEQRPTAGDGAVTDQVPVLVSAHSLIFGLPSDLTASAVERERERPRQANSHSLTH
jgi:hypothetical protein